MPLTFPVSPAAPLAVFRYLPADGGGSPRLGIQTGDNLYDLTGSDPAVFGTLGTWLSQADPVAAAGNAAAAPVTAAEPLPADIVLLAPVDEQEVWAAGVTYERSRVARREESAQSGGGDFYDRVYQADRPELFFKTAGWRVSGPNAPIRIRRDSSWDVPEPEMTLVLSAAGAIVGVTVGNDVSSRSIEGENPLYLPQAKSYDGACAVGPMIVLVGGGNNSDSGGENTLTVADLSAITIGLEIRRGEKIAFAGETTTARMKRTPTELAAWLFRELSFPQGVLLMTGTGVIPPDTFTLQSGDSVSITLAGIGTLTNPVA